MHDKYNVALAERQSVQKESKFPIIVTVAVNEKWVIPKSKNRSGKRLDYGLLGADLIDVVTRLRRLEVTFKNWYKVPSLSPPNNE